MNGWETHQAEQAARWAKLEPIERLRWLESSKRFVRRFAGIARAQALSVTSRALGRHYAWGQGCEGWHLVDTLDLSVVLERMPPATRDAPQPQARARQFFFVLRGELRLDVDGKSSLLRQGEGLQVEATAVHVLTSGEGDAEFLRVSHPPAQRDAKA